MIDYRTEDEKRGDFSHRNINVLPDHAMAVCDKCLEDMGGLTHKAPDLIKGYACVGGVNTCSICYSIGTWMFFVIKEWESLSRHDRILQRLT